MWENYLACVYAGETFSEKEEMLRFNFPTIFFAYMKSLGREKELYDGTITPYKYTWYLHGVIFPMLNKKREERKLNLGK